MVLLLLFLPFKLLYAVACHFLCSSNETSLLWLLALACRWPKEIINLFQWFCWVRVSLVCKCCQWGINSTAFVWDLSRLWSKTIFQHCYHRLNTRSVYSHHSQVSHRTEHSYRAVMLLNHWCQTEYAINIKESRRKELVFFTLTQSWMIHMDVNVWTRLWALSKSMPKWLPVKPELSACCFKNECSFLLFWCGITSGVCLVILE